MSNETEKAMKNIELEMQIRNGYSMLKELHAKYEQVKNITCLADPSTVKEHNKLLGDIAVSIGVMNAMLKTHLESDTKTQELIEKLFDRAETNGQRINTLETAGKIMSWIIGSFLVVWTAGKIIFK